MSNSTGTCSAQKQVMKRNALMNPTCEVPGEDSLHFVTAQQHQAALENERYRYNTMQYHFKEEIRLLQEQITKYKETIEKLKRQLQRPRKESKDTEGSESDASSPTTPNNEAAAAAAGIVSTKKRKRQNASAEVFFEKTKSVSTERPATRTKHDIKWDERFAELQAYHKIHGHCNVPRCLDNPLGSWVSTQRSQHSLMCRGKRHDLTPYRIQKLTSLGFQWNVLKTQPVTWETRFAQLCEFQQQHGHTRVPQLLIKPQGLGNWVMDQRKMYKDRDLPPDKRLFKTPISQERIDKLEAMGFEWSLRNRGSKFTL